MTEEQFQLILHQLTRIADSYARIAHQATRMADAHHTTVVHLPEVPLTDKPST